MKSKLSIYLRSGLLLLFSATWLSAAEELDSERATVDVRVEAPSLDVSENDLCEKDASAPKPPPTQERPAVDAIAASAAAKPTTAPATEPDSSQVLHISGATTIQTIAENLGALYTKKYGVNVHVTGGGSGRGYRNALSGESNLGMVSRNLTEEEKRNAKYLTIGFDALVFIVHKSFPLESIDRATIVSLYSREEPNWARFTEIEMPVVLVTKETGRATLDLFEGYTGLRHPKNTKPGESSISADAYEVGSNLEVMALVAGLRGAIGYVSMGSANAMIERGMPIRLLVLDGVAPTPASVGSNHYPIGRELNFVYKSTHGGVDAFLVLCQSDEARRIVAESGFIPAEGGQ